MRCLHVGLMKGERVEGRSGVCERERGKYSPPVLVDKRG